MNHKSISSIFNISNSLSIFRLILAIPISILLLSDSEFNRYLAVVIGIVALVSDGLDGYFARKYNQITEFGKIIDPVADKIVIGVVAAILVIKNLIPVMLLILIISRDFLILLGGLYMKKKSKVVPQSNMTGKIAAAVIAFYLLLSIVVYYKHSILKDVFLWMSVFFIVVSFLLYAFRFFNIIFSKE